MQWLTKLISPCNKSFRTEDNDDNVNWSIPISMLLVLLEFVSLYFARTVIAPSHFSEQAL